MSRFSSNEQNKFVNDGSFLEMFKQRMQEGEKSKPAVCENEQQSPETNHRIADAIDAAAGYRECDDPMQYDNQQPLSRKRSRQKSRWSSSPSSSPCPEFSNDINAHQLNLLNVNVPAITSEHSQVLSEASSFNSLPSNSLLCSSSPPADSDTALKSVTNNSIVTSISENTSNVCEINKDTSLEEPNRCNTNSIGLGLTSDTNSKIDAQSLLLHIKAKNKARSTTTPTDTEKLSDSKSMNQLQNLVRAEE